MINLVLITAAATLAMIPLAGLSFPLADTLAPAGACVGLAAVGFYYRREPGFRLVAIALATLVGFSAIFPPLTYAIAAGSDQPWADGLLGACDAFLGVDAGRIAARVQSRPTLAAVLEFIYFSIIPQTMVAIAVLGFANERRRLVGFLRGFILCALITAVCFYFFPARGTATPTTTPDYYVTILQHLEGLRDGSFTAATWRGAEGIVTFPSFHTIWAALLILAFWKHPLFVPVAILNVLVILTTVTTGMHYATDVIGGLAVVGFVTYFERR